MSIGSEFERDEFKALVKEAIAEAKEPKSNVTFVEYVDAAYLPHFIKKNNKDVAKDIRMVGLLCTYLGDCRMSEINEYTVQEALALLQYERKIKGTTINRYRARLSNIFNHAIRGSEHIISFNPVRNVEKYQESFRERKLSHYEAGVFLGICKRSRNTELYDIVLMAFHTGMRFNEIFQLKTNNINQYECYIELCDGETKSGYGRKIPIHKDIMGMICERYNRAAADGRLFKGKSVRTALENAIKRAKLQNFRFHDMRRTCATWLWQQGNDLHAIQKILGHSTITMTEKYLAASVKDLANVIASLPSIEVIE